MPPQLALFICILLILYLFWMDRKRIEGVSNAIWLVFIWMGLSGSREVSQWLKLGATSTYQDAILEGNPVDRAVFAVLIIAGVLILRRRNINWNLLFTKNAWIWLYFVFGAISFFWSDYSFVSFKRWIKALGTLVMVLLILTEGRPYAAIGVILRRLAFVLLPLSVIFIKYYPELGRQYHSHTGVQMLTGVATQKNGLGAICLLAGIYFSWNLFLGRRGENESAHQLHLSIYLIMLPMIAWLLYMSNSATSLGCTVVAVGLFLIAREPAVMRESRRVMTIVMACIVLFGIMELAFDITDTLIAMLGRRPDLTTRMPMWEDLLAMVRNPLIGVGYESFWLGDRLRYMTENWGIKHQAHNGYLEMYLNMGLIGVCFIAGWMVSGLRKINRHMAVDYPAAMLRLCFIVVIALYNWTEATFYGNTTLWLLLFLGIMDAPYWVRTSIPASNEYGGKRVP